MKQKALIPYIENLFHVCLHIPGTHQIKVCPAKDEVIEVFVEKYKDKKWIPTISYVKTE